MNNIKKLRELRGITQEDLAKRLGVVASTINRLESGKRRLSQQYLTDISRVLGCEPGDLLPGDGITIRKDRVPVVGRCSETAWSVPTGGAISDPLPIVAEGKLSNLTHEAFLIDDDSAGVAAKGAFVISVPFASARGSAIDGDWVVVKSTEGRMERFVVAQLSVDSRGPRATIDGRETLIKESTDHQIHRLIISTYTPISGV